VWERVERKGIQALRSSILPAGSHTQFAEEQPFRRCGMHGSLDDRAVTRQAWLLLWHSHDRLQLRSNSLNLPLIDCSFGFPALWSHASILLHWTSCFVLGDFTATVSRVAGPGASAVNPQRLNSAIASVAAS
jgi:hypothetical protein